MMKLYGSLTSPFVRHCRVALEQSGLDFELLDADYAMSAERSPTGKVPFFEDGDMMLTDSSSILKYVREKSGQDFLKEIDDYELYSMTNTLLDAAINVQLLEKDGFKEDQIPYIGRQNARIDSGLKELNRRFAPSNGIKTDSALRGACFIDWALFRKRFAIDGLDNLQGLLDAANKEQAFVDSAPPGRNG